MFSFHVGAVLTVWQRTLLPSGNLPLPPNKNSQTTTKTCVGGYRNDLVPFWRPPAPHQNIDSAFLDCMYILAKYLTYEIQSIKCTSTDFWTPYLVQMGAEIRQSVADVDTDSLLSQNWPPSPSIRWRSYSETESATTDRNGRKKKGKKRTERYKIPNSCRFRKSLAASIYGIHYHFHLASVWATLRWRGVTYKSCYAMLYLVVCLLLPHSEGTGITSLWVYVIRTVLSATEPYLEAEFGVSWTWYLCFFKNSVLLIMDWPGTFRRGNWNPRASVCTMAD